MTAIDWADAALGALAGAGAGAVYFAGLAWGMRQALRAVRPTRLLLLSGALRIAALLAAGWLVAGQGAWALAGFALGFLAVRTVAVALARRPVAPVMPEVRHATDP